MNLKKTLIISSIVMIGASVYSFYHGYHCYKEGCWFCEWIKNLVLATCGITGVTIYACLQS